MAGIDSTIIDQLDVAVVVTDLDGVITSWNKAAEALYGWRSDEAVGSNLIDLMIADSGKPAAEGLLGHIIEDGEPWRGDYEVLHKNGSRVHVHVSDSILYDESGEPAGVIGVALDISERKRAERRLAVQYGVIQAFVEAASLTEAAPKILQTVCENVGWEVAALWTVGPRKRVLRPVDVWVQVPGRWQDFVRATRDTTFQKGVGLPGRVWASGKPAWIQDAVRDSNFPRAPIAAKAGLHGAFAFPILGSRETLGVVEAFSLQIEEPDQELLRMMNAIGSQIGQFIERQDAEEAVRQTEARRRAILEASLDSIVAMDAEGRITEFNPAAEATFGYERDEVIGQPLADLIIPPSLRDRHRAGLARYVETGEASIIGSRIELTAMRKDGTEFPVELAVTRVDLPGRPMFKGALRDITERRRSEEERARLLEAERRARAETEAAHRRLAFLVEANVLLASSLDFAGTIKGLAELAVTLLADICLIDVVDDDGSIRRMAAVHADPAWQGLTDQLGGEHAPVPGGPHPAVKVMRTGQSVYSSEMSEAFLRETTRDERHFNVTRQLGFQSYICVPIAARRRVLGTITLVSTHSSRRYGPADLAAAEDLARRTAVTVDNARLYEAEQQARLEAERAADRNRVLQSVTGGLAEALTAKEVAAVMVERAVEALHARAGAVAMVSEDGAQLEIVHSSGYTAERIEPWTRFSIDAPLPLAEAVRTRQPVFVFTGEELRERYPALPERQPGSRALACVPLVVEGRAVGGMALTFPDQRDFEPDDQELLFAISRQGSQAMERARAYEAERAARAEAEAAERRLSFLAQASAELAARITDYEATLRNVARLAVPEFADWCVVDLLAEGGSIKRVALAHADPEKENFGSQLLERTPPDAGDPAGVARVLRTGMPEIFPNLTEELVRSSIQDPELLEITLGLGLLSSMTVPLIARDRILGAITFVTAESGGKYSPADLLLAEDLARRAALAVDNARLYQERSYVARTFQQTLLPPRLPTISGLDVGAVYRPAGEGSEIGGDFYDLFETADGSWAVAIGDVCGKGADAAAIIGLARYSLRAVAMQEQRPSRVLATVNEVLRQQSLNDKFCTVAYARLRPYDGGVRLTVCCGGHPLPIVVRREGGVETAGQPGTLLGVFPDPELVDRWVDLVSGDAIVFYTDGLTEERAGGSVFGEEDLISVLRESAGLDAQEIAAAVAGAVHEFRSESPMDDMAIVVLRVK